MTVPAGGFDPVLDLWDPSGNEIASSDDDTPSINPSPRVTVYGAGCLDSYLTNSLGAGTYTVGLAVSGNTPNGGPKWTVLLKRKSELHVRQLGYHELFLRIVVRDPAERELGIRRDCG